MAVSEESMDFESTSVGSADTTGRRTLLKQIAAGGAGVALVWAAPTVTRTDRASAAASPPPAPLCTFPAFTESFAAVSVPDTTFQAYGTGSYAGIHTSALLATNSQGFEVDSTPTDPDEDPANIDVLVAPAFGTGAFSSGTKMIGLGGSYLADGDGNWIEPRALGAVKKTFLSLPSGTYLLEFDFVHPTAAVKRDFDVDVTGAATYSATRNSGADVQGSVYTFTANFAVATAGDVTIRISDTQYNSDGMAFTNFRLSCV